MIFWSTLRKFSNAEAIFVCIYLLFTVCLWDMFHEDFVTNVMSNVKIKKTKKGLILTLRYLIIINIRQMCNKRQEEQLEMLKQTECKTHPDL